MPWVRIDDEMPHHPKVVQVGPLGFAMQVAGLCYCNRFLTDGFIPTAAVPTFLDFSELDEHAFNGRGGVCWMAVAKLVEAQVWEETENGYQIHDYLDYQPSKAAILAERERNSRAGRASATLRSTQRQHNVSTVSTQSQPNPNPTPKETTPLGNGVVKKSLTKEQEPLFNSFWSAYPRKEAKPAAAKAWAKLKPDGELVQTILTALAIWCATQRWQQEPQFIPHPATWLNNRRWEDEPPEPSLERSANGTAKGYAKPPVPPDQQSALIRAERERLRADAASNPVP